MPFATVNDASIHYRLDGPEGAPVLVLSNSLGTNLTMWEPQMPAFAEQFRVLRYDSRGHGASEATPGGYGIGQLSRDVLALLDALDFEHVHFCGLSMGGMVGQWLGVHAPHRLDRLVLCNTAARIPPAEMWNNRIDAVAQGGMAAIADGVLARWFTADFRTAVPEAVAPLRQVLLETPAEGYAGCCAAVRDMDQRQAVAEVQAPTLVIAGAHDQATPPDDGRFLAETIPGAACLELPAAHLSNVEQPAAFTEAVLEFLR